MRNKRLGAWVGGGAGGEQAQGPLPMPPPSHHLARAGPAWEPRWAGPADEPRLRSQVNIGYGQAESRRPEEGSPGLASLDLGSSGFSARTLRGPLRPCLGCQSAYFLSEIGINPI